MSRFDGKTALVVGGAQGMGLACAERFGAEGANLALFDIEEATLETAAVALRAPGYAVETVSGEGGRRLAGLWTKRRREHLRDIYSTADCHQSADGRDCSGWYHRVPRPANQ